MDITNQNKTPRRAAQALCKARSSSRISMHALRILLVLLGISMSNSLFAGNLGTLGKLSGWTNTYLGVSQSQAVGVGFKNVNESVGEDGDFQTSDIGFILGTAWFDRVSTEFRIIDLADYSDSPALLDQSSYLLADLSAVYYLGQGGSLDHYSKRNSVSPFVRVGFGSVGSDTIEFGFNTSGNDYLSLGVGVDVSVLDVMAIRAEVLALHADYMFGTVSFLFNFK